jgi:GR25 family glycosyltransferase involved in LPS biosynthesis
MNKFLIIIILTSIIIILGIYKVYNTFSNVGLNKCDAIMYINLDDREDRKKLLLNDLNEIGVDKTKIHRISAVKIPKNGHKGCIQSHLIALRMAKMNNWDMVCIMEDDAEIINKNSFNNDVENIFNDLKDINWDIIILSCANKKSESVINKNYIDKLKYATTSACYIIKSHYYDNMINLFEYCNQMMVPHKWGATLEKDDWEPYALDQKWNELIKQDNWYCPKNNLIKQREIKSSIMSRK